MRVLSSIAILAFLVVALAPATAIAQAGTQAKPPVQSPPPAAQQAPPAPKPAADAPTAPAPPPAVFPEGAKVAYLNIQAVAAESIEGKGYAAKVQALQQKRQKELDERTKTLTGLQQKLQQGANAMSEAALADLNKQVEKLQVELQRAQQDAQSEIQDLTQLLQTEFQRKIMPIIEQVAQKRSLHLVFSTDAGIVFANPGLDLDGRRHQGVRRHRDAAEAAGSGEVGARPAPRTARARGRHDRPPDPPPRAPEPDPLGLLCPSRSPICSTAAAIATRRCSSTRSRRTSPAAGSWPTRTSPSTRTSSRATSRVRR